MRLKERCILTIKKSRTVKMKYQRYRLSNLIFKKIGHFILNNFNNINKCKLFINVMSS